MADEFARARTDPWGALSHNRRDKKTVNRLARHRMNEQTVERVRQADDDEDMDYFLIAIFATPYNMQRELV